MYIKRIIDSYSWLGEITYVDKGGNDEERHVRIVPLFAISTLR